MNQQQMFMIYNEVTPLNNSDRNATTRIQRYHKDENGNISFDDYNEYWADERDDDAENVILTTTHDDESWLHNSNNNNNNNNIMLKSCDCCIDDKVSKSIGEDVDVTSTSTTMASSNGAYGTGFCCDEEEVEVDSPLYFDHISSRSSSLQNSLASSYPQRHRAKQQHDHHRGFEYQMQFAYLVCVVLGIVSGTMYGFGRYSRDLKDRLNLTQYEMELLGVLLDCGNFVTKPLCGIIYDRYGSRVTCLLAATFSFCGYSIIQLNIQTNNRMEEHHATTGTRSVMEEEDGSYVGSISHSTLALLCGCFFAVGMGCGLGHMAALASTTKIFSGGRKSKQGLAIGVVAAAFALCSTLIGSQTLVGYSTLGMDHFFFVWAFIIGTSNLVGSFILPPYDDVGSNDCTPTPKRLSQDDSTATDSHEDMNATMIIPEYEEMDDDSSYKEGSPVGYGAITIAQSERVQTCAESHDDEDKDDVVPSRSSTEILAWYSCDYWLIIFIFFGCTGCGLFVINNVSTMVQSMGGTDQIASQLVILLSLCNCFGRIGIGFLADKICQLNLFATSLGMIAFGMAISALANEQSATTCLSITIALVSLAYGGVWVLIVTILADWFGRENFGKNYGLSALAPALSGFVVNSISAKHYHRHSDMTMVDGGSDGASEVCIGVECYQGTFVLTACSALTCLLAFPILKHRRRRHSS